LKLRNQSFVFKTIKEATGGFSSGGLERKNPVIMRDSSFFREFTIYKLRFTISSGAPWIKQF